MRGEPLRLRLLWWTMVRAERIAHWCRARWLKWHETGGVVVPPYVAPRVRRTWFVVHEADTFKCSRCAAIVPTDNGSIDSLPDVCPACGYEGEART